MTKDDKKNGNGPNNKIHSKSKYEDLPKDTQERWDRFFEIVSKGTKRAIKNREYDETIKKLKDENDKS